MISFGVLAFSVVTSSNAEAQKLPSLFRGVVVTDSALGVRVVNVEEGSAAYEADLRADDLILQIHGTDIH
ncbi:MAG: PDZ domain-containing protein, partial [Candidatus Omnitrophica bacterium]|nr:PDZ domain-containing protein [Candidatus Omnitrophota bacterium]